jgi:hypothetical protein
MAVSPNGVQLSIWMAVFTFLTSVVIALRIWAIHLTRKSLQLHDYFVIIAHVCIGAIAYFNGFSMISEKEIRMDTDLFSRPARVPW